MPALVVAIVLWAAAVQAAGNTERGRALFAVAAGCGCHTSKDGPVGAGGGKVPTPFGTFYGSNITPDAESGIGNWSDAEIAAAIRDGYARGKGVESPAMPYYQYAGMSDADLADLIAYLRSLPAVHRANRAHEQELPFSRLAYRAWRLLFAPRAAGVASAPLGVERGHYLADHVAICTDCHTPRRRFGVPDTGLYLAGAADGPAGERVPNITPHSSGIGDWDEIDIYNLLSSAMKPNFDNVQGLMAEVIEGHGGGPGYKDAPEADRKAIAAYIKSITAIDNKVDAK